MSSNTINDRPNLDAADVVTSSDEIAVWDDSASTTKKMNFNSLKDALRKTDVASSTATIDSSQVQVDFSDTFMITGVMMEAATLVDNTTQSKWAYGESKLLAIYHAGNVLTWPATYINLDNHLVDVNELDLRIYEIVKIDGSNLGYGGDVFGYRMAGTANDYVLNGTLANKVTTVDFSQLNNPSNTKIIMVDDTNKESLKMTFSDFLTALVAESSDFTVSSLEENYFLIYDDLDELVGRISPLNFMKAVATEATSMDTSELILGRASDLVLVYDSSASQIKAAEVGLIRNQTLTSTSGATDSSIDMSPDAGLAPCYTFTMTGNTTFTFTDGSLAGQVTHIQLSGAFTPTWPAEVTTTVGTYSDSSVVRITNLDGGTNYLLEYLN